MGDEAKFFYANAVFLAVSNYDVSMRFVRNEPAADAQPGPGSQVVVADTFTVAMSITHAKSMLPVLMDAVVQYEKLFGKQALAPELQVKYDQHFGSSQPKTQ